jgi:hypothetical protein
VRSAAVTDTVPPVITLLDQDPRVAYRPGQAYVTSGAGGAAVSGRFTYVLANTDFTDPGAT